VFPEHEILPHVIVDHELTHVNLVANSNVGLLERILLFLEWIAEDNHNHDAADKAHAMSGVVLSATEITHEATAWFGTELQTAGHENLSAPAVYAADVARLRHLFEQMPNKPFTDLQSDLPTVMRIADDVAIYALSLPLMAEFWDHPEIISRESLRSGLRRGQNAPTSRFRRICSLLEKVPFPEVDAWSLALGKTHDRGLEAKADLAPPTRKRTIFSRRPRCVPAVLRHELRAQDTIGVIQALAKRIGLIDGKPIKLFIDAPANAISGKDALLEAFAWFEVTHAFDRHLDRYSQVCVLETARPARELLLHRSELQDLMYALSGSAYLTVRLARGERVKFHRPVRAADHVILTGPYGAKESNGRLLCPTAHAQIRTARNFLEQFGRFDMASKPILVSSAGYDFGAGDYADMSLLKHIPHVVVAIRDFRSLWMSLGRNKGLRGCTTIEWRAMPSPSGRKYFGFLLFKPTDNPFPIVVNPCVVYYLKRIMTAAEDLPSTAVQLAESFGDPYEWLGLMTHAVMTAAAVFEMGPHQDAVMRAALSHGRAVDSDRVR
jgi:hypothetical protein